MAPGVRGNHRPRALLHGEEDAGQIDVEHPLPRGVVDLQQRRRARRCRRRRRRRRRPGRLCARPRGDGRRRRRARVPARRGPARPAAPGRARSRARPRRAAVARPPRPIPCAPPVTSAVLVVMSAIARRYLTVPDGLVEPGHGRQSRLRLPEAEVDARAGDAVRQEWRRSHRLPGPGRRAVDLSSSPASSRMSRWRGNRRPSRRFYRRLATFSR